MSAHGSGSESSSTAYKPRHRHGCKVASMQSRHDPSVRASAECSCKPRRWNTCCSFFQLFLGELEGQLKLLKLVSPVRAILPGADRVFLLTEPEPCWKLLPSPGESLSREHLIAAHVLLWLPLSKYTSFLPLPALILVSTLNPISEVLVHCSLSLSVIP